MATSEEQIRIKLTIETVLAAPAGRNQQIIKILVHFSPKLVLSTLEFILKAGWKKSYSADRKHISEGTKTFVYVTPRVRLTFFQRVVAENRFS